MKSRLRKLNFNQDLDIEVGRPSSLVFPQYDQKIENDNINKIQYGPSNHINWDFEKNKVSTISIF